MTTTPCWNDPRIRSRERSDFVLKFDKLNNPRAMSQKKYNETLQQMGEFGPTCHVQSVYNVCNQKDASGRNVLRLVELKSGKPVIPLEDVFDEIERIHLQHDHLCNIAKFYQSLKEASTNLATGNISFEMAKDFIIRCQTCTINSQQKSSKTTQNSGLFAPKLSPTKFPKKNARPESSPLSNGASSSGGNGKSDAKNGSKNGSSNNGHNFVKPSSQPSFVAPSPIYTAVNRQFFPPTPLSNQPFSSMTSSSTKDFNYKPGWMPVFTSTPLATKAAQPRIDISSFLTPQFTPLQNNNANQLANTRSVIVTGPTLQTSNAFTQNTTVIICDEPEVPAIREAVQNAEGNASITEPVVKQEVHPIEEMLQKYIDVGEWKNDFIFTDTECRQILGELARTHFGMWELKESRTNPGEFYFFNKKNGTCQWNEPDAWVDEIKKRVSIEKVLRIEQDDEVWGF
uniref:WW domain-containing protein n=1 Tax=Meloidogyne incognita TaxID=6306 RepID=A0A914LHX6_MELIC